MNSILQLKGQFNQRPNSTPMGFPQLPKGKTVSSAHLQALAKQLQNIEDYWNKHTEIAGTLISVHYRRIVAKSNRLKILLSTNSQAPTASIRGAKFEWDVKPDGTRLQKHVFTHYIPLGAIERSIILLNTAAT